MPRFPTLIRSRTLRVAGVVAALAVTTPFTVPASADVEKISCRKAVEVQRAGVWQRFPKPTFEPLTGIDVDLLNIKQEVAAMAVHPGQSKTVAVTNGNSVYVSRNGGCDWNLSLRLDDLNPSLGLTSAKTTRIRSLQITGRGTFLAIAEDLETDYTVGRPYVLRSTSGVINSWQNASSGLPPLGKPLVVRGHRTNPDVLYMSIAEAQEPVCRVKNPVTGECLDGNQQTRRLGLLYRSTNGGSSWQSRTAPSGSGLEDGVTEIKYFSVDDNDPAGNMVWVVADEVLQLSTDGGSTFRAPDGLDQDGIDFTAVESLANHGDSRQLELVAFGENSQMIRKHKTKGWITSQLPFQSVESAAQRPGGDIAVTTTPAAGPVLVWRIYPQDFQDFEDKVNVGGKVLRTTFGWEEITPMHLSASGDIVGADAPGPADGTFYVKDPGFVLRFLRSRVDRDPPGVPPFTVGPPPFPKGRITPTFYEKDLDLGKRTTVPYTLTLPPAPTPIDLYLLVDNSGSMQPTIDDLKANLGSLADKLHNANVDIAIGVGQINVQPDRQSVPIDDPRTPDVDESKPKPIYQRLHPVSPVTGELAKALSKLDGNGGSGQEPQLEALWQSVTGEGLELVGFTGPLLGYNIKPGHNAAFREGLNPFKFIVHATDEKFSTDIRSEDAHNDRTVVAKTLKDAGVLQIGLSQGMDDAHADLEWMAKATGALAPAEGADCDGDGKIGAGDVRPFKPLVCGQSDGLDQTLVNLIQAIEDPATITLHPNNAATMVKVSKTSFDINAKEEATLRFSVTYSCEGLEPGQYVNEINASLRGFKIAGATANINCGGVTAPPPPQVPPQLATEPLGNPPPPQPQPIAPVPIPLNPVPQVQPQTQVQSQVNPQGGMADQEEEQFQLAAAENDVKRDEEQLAMTAVSYEASPAVVLALGMTMAAGAGLAVGLRRRSRTASAKATVRR